MFQKYFNHLDFSRNFIQIKILLLKKFQEDHYSSSGTWPIQKTSFQLLTPKFVDLCNSEDETVDYIFLYCPLLSGTRDKLQTSYKALGLDFNLPSPFTKFKLQCQVEDFLVYGLFHKNFKESKIPP